MMSILLKILILTAKCMFEADPKFWLVKTLDGKSDTNGVEVEKKKNGADYQGNGVSGRPDGPGRPGSRCVRSPVAAKNVESLSQEERTNLLNAMRRLHNSTAVWFDIGGIHGLPIRPACNNRFCCEHQSQSFLPWHRLYLAYINAAIRRHQQNTVIPYWDWTSRRFTSIAQSNDSPFFQGFINSRNSRINNTNTRRGGTQARDPPRYLEHILDALAEDDFRIFQEQVELVHNTIHGDVGGHMGFIEYAAFDPIFYLHHAFVDLVWVVRQVLRPDEQPTFGFDQVLPPFGLRGRDTMECSNYNLETGIVFGDMTLAQIRQEVARRSGSSSNSAPDYRAYGDKKKDKIQDKIYAGFFLKSFGVSGTIKFNICKSVNNHQSEDCSIPGGELYVFGGKNEKNHHSSIPYKVDVTEAVTKAGLNVRSMCRFKVTSFQDPDGNKLTEKLKEIYQPITVFRSVNSQKYTYLFVFNKEGPQAPKVTIVKHCSYQITSENNDIDENQNCYGNSNKSAKSALQLQSYMEWQQANSDKYKRWNTKGTHIFSSRICNDKSYTGSQIKITKE